MLSRPRNAVLCALALALVAGYFVTGHYLYKAPIGLDASAFLAGEWIQSLWPAHSTRSRGRSGRSSRWSRSWPGRSGS